MSRYTIAAIPTEYRGVRFRSRLEATWAAFFDRLGWEWQYEPFETRGWIPDFALRSALNAPRPVLVEVKPIMDLDMAVLAKIDAADDEHEVVLVGCGPVYDGSCLGWLRENIGEWYWGAAPFGRWKGDESEAKNPSCLIGFCHAEQSRRDRITGCYDGECYGAGRHARAAAEEAWGEAKHAVQWRRPVESYAAGADRLRQGLKATKALALNERSKAMEAAKREYADAFLTADGPTLETIRARLETLLEEDAVIRGRSDG